MKIHPPLCMPMRMSYMMRCHAMSGTQHQCIYILSISIWYIKDIKLNNMYYIFPATHLKSFLVIHIYSFRNFPPHLETYTIYCDEDTLTNSIDKWNVFLKNKIQLKTFPHIFPQSHTSTRMYTFHNKNISI